MHGETEVFPRNFREDFLLGYVESALFLSRLMYLEDRTLYAHFFPQHGVSHHVHYSACL